MLRRESVSERPPWRLAAALALLLVPAAAQQRPRSEPGGVAQRAASTEAEDSGRAAPNDAAAAPGKVVRRPERRSANARGQCRFDVSVEPERLLPGQTGLATILMVFEADAVLESSSNLRIEPVPGDGSLSAGPVTVHPPELSTIADGYRGRAVYDNWAMIEMPVTMSPGAALGSKQQLSLDAHFELHRGATAKSLGRFRQRLTIACEVGSVADPHVQMPGSTATRRTQRPAGDSARATARVAALQEQRAPEPPRSPAALGGLPTPTDGAPRIDSPRSPSLAPESSSGWPLLLVGGGIVAALAWLLAVGCRRVR